MEETKELPTKNQKKARIEYSRIKRTILRHVTLVRIFILVLALSVFGLLSLLVVKGTQALNIPTYFNTAYNFATLPLGQLATFNGRTNILVMGKAGGTHDGPDLTDTMMLVSISIASRDVKIISIPRDTWIAEIRAKINSAYYWGNQKDTGTAMPAGRQGITFAKAISEIVTGVPIQYGVVIDFSGFKDIIDQIGGVQVDVTNSFTDYYYPIVGRENDTCGGNDPGFTCRYETLIFNKGSQIMNGDTALKFVRSRHSSGLEGTDIAREGRQGKVIDALKNKLLDKNTYKNPGRDIAILKVVLNSIQTDIDLPTAGILARLAYESRNSITNYLIPQDLMVTPPVSAKYDMQSVFIPKLGSGKWEEINKWVATTLQIQTY